MENQLLQQHKSEIKQRGIKGYFGNMCYFFLDYLMVSPLLFYSRSILNIILLHQRPKAEITRYHKEKRHTETADGLHRNARDSRKFAVHEHHEHTGNACEKVKAVIVLFCCTDHF